MPIPPDYAERVYAGVLGKIIGVYLGRPFEGWSYDAIMAQLGEINYYVHEKRGVPLIVTDDDISGTFTFIRALPDYGNPRPRSGAALTPAQIGQTWLNYLIEGRTVLWWGGLGNSTEHTAYLRLKHGVAAPGSGSRELNGRVVSEQIGAQIFIDGWALVSPGDPAQAAALARKAASVSHDGEAIYGAQVVAALEAQAFVESDIGKLLDTAVSFIPSDSLIYRLIADLRDWRTKEKDWRLARLKLQERYGYDQYGGGCHMVPNHGVIVLALLYGDGDFQKTLMIGNTSGWDTDCNSGNIGCIMGIRGGLAGIDAGPDWRGPVADRMYLPTADGGGCVTDAVTQAFTLVNIGRALAGKQPVAPKDGAKFHFELPGAVQGFVSENTIEARGVATLENVKGHSTRGRRSLAIRYRHLAPGRFARAATATFMPPETLKMPGYSLFASPTLYPGQVVRAALAADAKNPTPVNCRLYVRVYGEKDELVRKYGPAAELPPGQGRELEWKVEAMPGTPIAEVGVELASEKRDRHVFPGGSVYLDYLTWTGTPEVEFARPDLKEGTAWQRAWVNGQAVGGGEHWFGRDAGPEAEYVRFMQNEGRGLLIQGTREWRDYRVSAAVRPHLAGACGLAARVQGMQRYYALLLVHPGQVRLVKRLDGEQMLAQADLAWQFDQRYALTLEVRGDRLRGWVDGREVFNVRDAARPLEGGAVALVCEEGRVGFGTVKVAGAE